jgi:hypothetical protein
LKSKQFLAILLLVADLCAIFHISTTPNLEDINFGIVTVKNPYNWDYKVFDPMEILYTGLQTDADVTTSDYHDDFNITIA